MRSLQSVTNISTRNLRDNGDGSRKTSPKSMVIRRYTTCLMSWRFLLNASILQTIFCMLSDYAHFVLASIWNMYEYNSRVPCRPGRKTIFVSWFRWKGREDRSSLFDLFRSSYRQTPCLEKDRNMLIMLITCTIAPKHL